MHFPGLNNSFGGAASVILPCSQPPPLLVIRGSVAKCILAASINAFGCALGDPEPLLLLRRSTRSALNLQRELSECINPAL